jgi:hypothetical protein
VVAAGACPSPPHPARIGRRPRFAFLGAAAAFLVGDPIAAAHLLMITGMLTYDPYDQILPPLHVMSTAQPLYLLLLSYSAYQGARLLVARSPRRRGPLVVVPAPLEAPRWPVLATAAVCAFVVVAVQIWNLRNRGSLAEIAAAKADGTEEFGPLNRITYNALPFLTAVVYYSSFFHRRLRTFAYALIVCCVAGLALTLFKVNLILFLLLLLFLGVTARRQMTPTLGALLRSPRLVIMLGVFALGMFHFSEGDDLATSVAYIVARIILFSWEGFAYVVETPAGPDVSEQLAVFLGHHASPSPDVVLASEMLHMDAPPIGIVVTYPGFLYRNWQELGVVVGAFVLGLLAQAVMQAATADRRPARVVLCFSIYFALLSVFLVGNVFNTLRGELATLLAAYVLVALVGGARRASAPSDDPAAGRAASAATATEAT